jgi:hypothetical protein
MHDWYRCSGGGPAGEGLPIVDVLAGSHEVAAYEYSLDVFRGGHVDGDIDVHAARLDAEDPGQTFKLHVALEPRVRARST